MGHSREIGKEEEVMSENMNMVMSMDGQPIHIKLIRNTRGYQWEISVNAETINEALTTLQEIDTKLHEKYKNGGEE